jgi:hypothetical protein
MCAVPNMAVFCGSLTSWFPGMLLTYFLNDFEMVPAVPIITGITFVFTFHNYYYYYYLENKAKTGRNKRRARDKNERLSKNVGPSV